MGTSNDIYNGVFNARELRGRRFADHVCSMMRDFLPSDKRAFRLIWEHLADIGIEGNIELINVPLECDALDKAQLEARMLDIKFNVYSQVIKDTKL